MKFYSSCRIDVRRIGQLKEGEEVVGQRVRAKVVKNKVAPPFRVAEFDMMHASGISYEGDVLDLAIAQKLVVRSGAWFRYGEVQLGQGREKTRAYMLENPELVEELRDKIMAAGELPPVVSDCGRRRRGGRVGGRTAAGSPADCFAATRSTAVRPADKPSSLRCRNEPLESCRECAAAWRSSLAVGLLAVLAASPSCRPSASKSPVCRRPRPWKKCWSRPSPKASDRSWPSPGSSATTDDRLRPDAPNLFNQLRSQQPPGRAIPSSFPTNTPPAWSSTAEGLILTANHVLRDDSDYWVTTADRKTYKVIKIVGADPRSDLAVLADRGHRIWCRSSSAMPRS